MFLVSICFQSDVVRQTWPRSRRHLRARLQVTCSHSLALLSEAGGYGEGLPPSLEGKSPLAGGSVSTTGPVEPAAPAVVSTELNADGDSVVDTAAYIGKNV